MKREEEVDRRSRECGQKKSTAMKLIHNSTNEMTDESITQLPMSPIAPLHPTSQLLFDGAPFLFCCIRCKKLQLKPFVRHSQRVKFKRSVEPPICSKPIRSGTGFRLKSKADIKAANMNLTDDLADHLADMVTAFTFSLD